MDSAVPTTLTREQLYELLWKEATRTVAQRLGFSDVGLAKICRKLHIPRPWRGYWREKETGHRPRQPKLPPWPAHLGPEPQSITFRAAPAGDKAAPSCPPEPENVQQQRAYEVAPGHRIVAAETLAEPDRLVRRAGRVLKRPGGRNLLQPSERPCLDIQVSYLDSRIFAKREFFEVRNGNCRLVPDIAAELAQTTELWADALGPVVEDTAQRLHRLGTEHGRRRWLLHRPSSRKPALVSPLPTPLTEQNRRQSRPTRDGGVTEV